MTPMNQSSDESISQSLTIRNAEPSDAALIVRFIRALAEYEREPDAAVVTEADILRDGFGPNPKFHVLIAEWGREPAAFAFYFFVYSTWEGRPGLFLEDLFVIPELRRHGVGRALMQRLAQIALANNCYGMGWHVLDWNEPAIRSYEAIGATFADDWRIMRLKGDALHRLAEEKQSAAVSK